MSQRDALGVEREGGGTPTHRRPFLKFNDPAESVTLSLSTIGRDGIVDTFLRDATLGQMQHHLCRLFQKSFPANKACLLLNGALYDDFSQRPLAGLPPPLRHSPPRRSSAAPTGAVGTAPRAASPASTPRCRRDAGREEEDAPHTPDKGARRTCRAAPGSSRAVSTGLADAEATVVFGPTDDPALFDALDRLKDKPRRLRELVGDLGAEEVQRRSCWQGLEESRLQRPRSDLLGFPPPLGLPALGTQVWPGALLGFLTQEDAGRMLLELRELDVHLSRA